MRQIIQSVKHYAQHSLAAVAAGAIAKKDLIKGQENADVTSAVDVVQGSIVKAIYIELWVHSDDAASGTVIFTVEKRGGGQPAMTTTQIAALHTYPNKKHVLYTTMGLIPNNVTYPWSVFKGWIKIPKGLQRFGLDDVLNWNLFAQSNGLSFCGFATYKAYT